MGKFSLFKLKLLSIRRGVETESITSLVNNFSPNFTLSDLGSRLFLIHNSQDLKIWFSHDEMDLISSVCKSALCWN